MRIFLNEFSSTCLCIICLCLGLAILIQIDGVITAAEVRTATFFGGALSIGGVWTVLDSRAALFKRIMRGQQDARQQAANEVAALFVQLGTAILDDHSGCDAATPQTIPSVADRPASEATSVQTSRALLATVIADIPTYAPASQEGISAQTPDC